MYDVQYILISFRRDSRVRQTDRRTDGSTDRQTYWQQMPRLTTLLG